MKNKISGIYKIINIYDNKVYVGSSIDIKRRWHEHKKELRKNKHCNLHLQFAWNKYGEQNFQFEIIEIVDNPTKENLLNREQYWIDKLCACNENEGYNILSQAGSNLGTKMSDALKQKQKEIRESKPIIQVDLNGNIIKVWNGIKEINREYNISPTNILNCVKHRKGRNQISKGYLWLYKEEEEYIGLYLQKYKNRSCQPIKIIQLTMDNQYIKEWDGLSLAGRELLIPYQNIDKCCRGKQKTCHGFKWMYKEDYDKMKQDKDLAC